MTLTKQEIARMVDISAVQAFSTETDVKNIITAAKEHRFICVFSLTGFLPMVLEALKGEDDIKVGGVVAFPGGGEMTEFKVAQAAKLAKLGCGEMDMVMNVGMLKSGMYQAVKDDIRAVKDAAGDVPLKVIMEVPLLTDDEICHASEIICDSGAQFLKTGTGWNGATDYHHIEVIKNSVGDALPLKVAGGVRKLETLLKMVDMGVSRFGIGYQAALNIMDEIK